MVVIIYVRYSETHVLPRKSFTVITNAMKFDIQLIIIIQFIVLQNESRVYFTQIEVIVE